MLYLLLIRSHCAAHTDLELEVLHLQHISLTFDPLHDLETSVTCDYIKTQRPDPQIYKIPHYFKILANVIWLHVKQCGGL